ncbi:hypothetical protein GCM10018777_10200 [Streptomyces albogriseolus]|nr:hypothetical protein GCM10018777_10200 [Streptomyces viridodiastaticus]
MQTYAEPDEDECWTDREARDAALPMPEPPCADPAFAVLGVNSRVPGTLVDLWRRWQSGPGRLWEGAGTCAYLSDEIVRGIRGNEVPDLVAEQLLSPASGLPCSPADAEPDLPERDHGPERRPGTVRPGIFEDNPVFDRRPVTLDHIRALRTLAPRADELGLVFSASGGAEVLPLGAIERRLTKGWLGVRSAGARHLPGSVIGPEEPEAVPSRGT